MRRYCWDTSVFLAWIQNEDHTRTADEWAGLVAAVDDIEQRRASLVASVVVLCEVLQTDVDDEAADRFRAVFGRESILLIDVTARIAERAGRLRRHFLRSSLKLSTPDAIHLATAQEADADEMHAFDTDLLRLNGRLPDSDLPVVAPRGRQTRLALPD